MAEGSDAAEKQVTVRLWSRLPQQYQIQDATMVRTTALDIPAKIEKGTGSVQADTLWRISAQCMVQSAAACAKHAAVSAWSS